jgi:HD superfamily phosphodiesterase
MTDEDRIRRYDSVWRAAATYLRARKNDIHIPISFALCQELLTHYPDADADVCSLAILLHDIGWHQIDMVDIIEKGFGPNMMQSDVRFRHEAEGVRMANEILAATGWSESIIKQVAEIIEGHDTRPLPKSLNDRIVRDSDKLWRWTVIGAALASEWFKCTPQQYVLRQDQNYGLLETEAARPIAEREHAIAKRVLMTDLL